MAFGVSVDFNANVAKFSKQVDKINGDLDRFSRQVKKSSDQSKNSFNAISASAKRMGAAIAVAFSARAVVGGLKEIVSEQELLHRNLLRTEALLKSTGNASGFTSGQLHEQARELALATLESTEGIMQAQQVLLTFKNVSGDTFTQAIEAAQDLSVTLSTDLRSSTTQLAKALQDPVKGMSAMSRSGVSFSETSREMIKNFAETNQLAKAQQVILDELAAQYGGIARNEAKGFAGAMDGLGQQMDEFQLHLGDNLGLMEAFSRGANFMAEALYALDVSINGVNTGLVDKRLTDISNQMVTAKQELQELEDKYSNVDQATGKGRFKGIANEINDEIIAKNQEINSLLTQRAVIMKQQNADRAKANEKHLETQRKLAEPPPENLQSDRQRNQRQLSGRNSIKQTTSALQEMTGPASVWLKNLEEGARLTEAMRTPLENLNKEIAQYTNLADHGIITQETLNRALENAGADYNKLTDKVEGASDEMSVYAEQAARNMQDAFADFLFDPFEDGIQGMLKGFLKVIQRMVAEQAAAQIFGEEGLNVGGLFSDAVKGVFGGIFHDGGMVGQAGPTRSVSPAIFAGAPRFHSGGYPGLSPDEVPAILQKGELVLSKKQVANSMTGIGGDQVNISTYVEVSGGNSNDQNSAQLGKLLNSTIRQVIVTEQRPGGLLA